MSAFARLAPRLQEAIVSRLGWTSLRPVQDLATHALLDGNNAVVLAPTAGGKTEASIFPALSLLLTEGIAPVGAIYLAPIKALLNNQDDRLGRYTEMVGLDRFLWHGDVDAAARRRFLDEPADLLMTTPESLEVMLASPRVSVPKLFADLRIVVIDEVHALAGTDRGAHMLSVLERIADHSRHDVQRVGLSATVGNPDAILDWLRGTSRRPGVVVDPPKQPRPRQVAVQLETDDFLLAGQAAALAAGKKSLFFCESRALTEQLADRMRNRGTDVFVHHSSVSLAERRLAEERFSGGGSAAIVCTSTLELGIDVGDLDQVFQANAPATVSSFLQRMGRTGRREGTTANTTFFCDEPDAVLQAIALIELAKDQWVESIPPQGRCWPVLVHQLLAFTLEAGGVRRADAHRKLLRLPDLAEVTAAELDAVIDHMLATGYLALADGWLSMGETADRVYGRKNFQELYAVFSSPQLYRVLGPAGAEIGSLDQAFVDTLVEEMTAFLLGGRAWVVGVIDHQQRTVSAAPAPRGKKPAWGGFAPKMLSYPLCQKIKQVLAADTAYAYLADPAAVALAQYRDEFRDLVGRAEHAIQEDADGLRWWTYAGGAINHTLKYALAELTGWKVLADSFRLRFEGDGVATAALLEAVRGLARPALWDDLGLWQRILGRIPPYRFSKFQPALPARYQTELVGRYLLDLDGTRRFVAALFADGADAAPTGLLGRIVATMPVAAPAPAPLEGVPLATPTRPIHHVATDAALRAACDEFRRLPAIAFDVETTLYERELRLVQIGTPTASYVIDPLALDDLAPLADILEHQGIVKIIHNAAFERSVMATLNIAVVNVFDTLAASRRLRGKALAGGHSLAAVCARELNRQLDKTTQTSDWSRRPLSPAQLAYAALDVEVLIDLHRWFEHQQPRLV